MDDHIDIVFDGPPAQEMPRLVEVDSGSSSPVVLVGSARLVYPQKRKCERAVHDGEKVPKAAVSNCGKKCGSAAPSNDRPVVGACPTRASTTRF